MARSGGMMSATGTSQPERMRPFSKAGSESATKQLYRPFGTVHHCHTSWSPQVATRIRRRGTRRTRKVERRQKNRRNPRRKRSTRIGTPVTRRIRGRRKRRRRSRPQRRATIQARCPTALTPQRPPWPLPRSVTREERPILYRCIPVMGTTATMVEKRTTRTMLANRSAPLRLLGLPEWQATITGKICCPGRDLPWQHLFKRAREFPAEERSASEATRSRRSKTPGMS
mmetsp:Transcript_11155/g.34174  ORF Transcript_11155/g.34174 Transcript_11155/m.34174 type:complete len:228 (+) Transcript_11155:491-1174(+)